MQVPALRIADELGLEACAVDADPQAPGRHLAARFERIDLKDEEGILAYARSLASDGGLGGVFTAGTDFSPAVAMVAEELGLPGISRAVARRAQDKGLMRQAFKEAGVPCPRFCIVEEGGRAMECADEEGPIPGPWVVKPADSMGARGCLRVDSAGRLEAAAADALRYSRTGRAIIEEYLEGPEFSVDALVWEGTIEICGLADRHIFFPPRFIEMGHTMPSAFPEEDRAEVLRVFEAGVRAIGIDRGAAKGDIMLLHGGQAKVGEIAARLSGGYMSGWTYPYASGVEATAGAIRIAMGRCPGDLHPRFARVSAERAFISIPGRVLEIRGLEEARRLPGLKDLFVRIRPGDRVSFPANNVEKCGNAISAAQDRSEACSIAEEACRRILIRLAPCTPETDAFLASREAFPPPAFESLPRGFLDLVASLPDEAAGEGPGMGVMDIDISWVAGALDWHGMNLDRARDAALGLSGAGLGRGGRLLGRTFWEALIRGGYQGGAYALDSAAMEDEKRS
jgi:biotin carboxylase